MPFTNMCCMRRHIETSDYYVAYFDVLGYKDNFNKDKKDVQIFIDDLCSAIDDTIAVINNMLSSDILKLAQMNIEYRIFSDNVLICLKKGARLLSLFVYYLFCRQLSISKENSFWNMESYCGEEFL